MSSNRDKLKYTRQLTRTQLTKEHGLFQLCALSIINFMDDILLLTRDQNIGDINYHL